jgi:cyclophilin family peptidyl-prolyl cis-trans isomerase
MYDLLFQKNAEWDPMTPAQFEEWLKDQAAQIGLNAGEFAADLKSEATRSRSQAMYDTARSFNLQSVPLLLINGQAQPAFALDQASIESSVSLIALGQRQFTDCPAFTIDPGRDYIATLHTERGDIVIQLFPDKAPLAVNSFVFLARSGWFDNTTFHRVISGFMAQAGDPTGTGRGNPGYFFDDEIHPTLRFDKPGVVAMANQGPDTNGSQFFITYAAAPHLDGVHTIFGQVFSGMDVLAKLTPRDPQQAPSGPSGDRLLSVEIEEK